jgi:hypothetical protein
MSMDNIQSFNKQFVKEETTDFEVHTIPPKFLFLKSANLSSSGAGKKSGRGLKRNLIIGGLVFAVIAGLMVLAAWLFLKSVGKTPAPVNQPVNNNVNSQPENPVVPPPVNINEAEILDQNQWLTLDNAEYFYQLKYPKAWLKEVVNTPTMEGDFLETITLREDGGNNLNFSVSVYKNIKRTSFDEWVASRGVALDKLETYTLSSEPAYRDVGSSTIYTKIYTTFNDRFYSLNLLKSDQAIAQKIYDAIILSWQFIPPMAEEDGVGDVPVIAIPSADGDSDGLTDVEEALYRTDLSKSDTDGDGFTDGAEIVNGYDPTISGGAKIYNSNLLSTYANNPNNYSLAYPASWTKTEQSNSVIFQDAGGEFIQVLVDEAADSGSISAWYQENISPDLSGISELTVAGQNALKSPDNLRVYLLYQHKVYSLIYNINLRQDANFLSTFAMMIKSFQLRTP